MKKILSLALCAVMILSLTACTGASNKNQGDTMSLEEIFTSILTGVDNLPELSLTPLNTDNYHYYLFIGPIEGAEALADDASINAVPHSAVLLRVPEGMDAAVIAAEIEENADLNKWICVGAEKKIVKVHGNTILLVMSYTEIANQISTNFDKLWE